VAALGLYGGAAPAAAASGCDNLFGQRCRVELRTGVQMSYFDVGPSSGETVILLHTDTTSAVEWAWTVAALTHLDPALHVYAIDQRGAGTTDLPQTAVCWSTPNLCITQDDLAADLLAFMDAERIATATLVGHALGAGVARNVAINHPERVRRLVISGIGVPPPSTVADDRDAQPRSAASPPVRRASGLDSLGWQQRLEARGVRWPEGALHMRPVDIDPDAVRNISQHWDISVIAAPEVVAMISAQTAAESLATWGVLDPTPRPRDPPARLNELSVPTLVLWGSEDFYFDRASQERLIAELRRASESHPGMYFFWKQFGVRPAPASHDKHDADDIGHNLSWEAPGPLAAEIDSFVRNGSPTRDLYRSDAPTDIRRILVEPGKAVIVSSRR
jgi:non-heme chloroperoxidase